VTNLGGRERVKYAYEPTDSSGRSLPLFLKHEVKRDISTPPRWNSTHCRVALPPPPVVILPEPVCTPDYMDGQGQWESKGSCTPSPRGGGEGWEGGPK